MYRYFFLAAWSALGVLKNWFILAMTLFLASVVWNGVTEAKSSGSTRLPECPADSWGGGHQPAHVPQRPAAPGGGQPPAAHSHSAVQHHAGKCSSIPRVTQGNLNSNTQIVMETLNFIPLCIPLLCNTIGNFPIKSQLFLTLIYS